MNLSEALQARERLKPLRRILDDLDGALDFAHGFDARIPELTAQKLNLEAAIAGLQVQHAEVKAAVEKESSDHVQRLADNQARFEVERDRLRIALAELTATVQAETARAEAKKAELEEEHLARKALLQETIHDLEEHVGKLTATLEGFRRDVAPLVR
jgi:chromosome segregation ATPase